MGTQNNLIVIGGIGLALVVALFLVFRNFDLSKVGKDVQEGLENFAEDANKGISEFSREADEGIKQFSKNLGNGLGEFFETLDPQKETPQTRETKETLETFERQVEEKKQQSISAGFDSVEEFERATDPNSIFNAKTDDDLRKFNPPNTIGFGISSINQGRGIADTAENREKLFAFIGGDTSVFENKVENFNLPNPFEAQQAFAEEIPEVQTVIQAPRQDRPLNLSSFAKSKSQNQSKPKNVTIKGVVRSELDTPQEFEIFGQNKGNRDIIGVVRETPRNPNLLRTNSKKQALETASERANRVFIESGKFADENRGFGVTKASERNTNFGTNTGSALKKATTGTNSKTRLADRKKIEEQKALKVFDSGSISNF